MISLVAIGASSGGIEAINRILQQLPAKFTAPIVIILHFPKNAQVRLESIFRMADGREVVEVRDKMPVKPGSIYFAPPGYHLLVEKEENFSLTQDEPVNFSIPSIDVFFESAAQVYRDRLAGVLLTGANADGAEGLKTIANLGGITYVQDPATASMPIMPESALKVMTPTAVLDLESIGQRLFQQREGEVLWRI